MASIDNRIVNMEFNNGEFEKRVSDTMKTLAGLDKAIAMTGTQGNGLEAIAKSANSFNMDGMSSAIEGVSAKFIALSTIGITALANLTNKAVDAGLSIAKSLAIAPISSGFAEYELKLNSIQTIMAGTGADLATVNAKLQELNTYSDQTIYSFADMTSNIGKFTNAGISLDQSVASIKGIANVAALSGANSEEASRAMYNFAQALSKGYVQLVDWKSIELANMGTSEFKTQLLQAAEAAGTLTKQGDAWVTSAGTIVSANQNFNDSLTDQWLTTEALNSALADYADSTTDIGARATAAASDVKTFSQLMDVTKESIGSGWSQSFEILVGNFDEAKWLFGGINKQIGDIIGKNAQARNDMLQGWKDMGGRNEFIIGVDALVRNLAAMFGPIKDAFREVFPPMTSERLFEITHAFMEFAMSLKPSEKTVENIGRIFKGVFNVLGVGIDVLKFLIGSVKDFIRELIPLGNGKTLEFFAMLGDALASISSEKIIGGIQSTFGTLLEWMKKPIPYIQALMDKVREFFSSISIDLPNVDGPLTQVLEGVKNAFSNIGSAIGDAFSSLHFGGIGQALSTLGAVMSAQFHLIIDSITGMFSSGGELQKSVEESSSSVPWDMILGGVGIAMVGGLIASINRLINEGIDFDITGGLLGSITGTFNQLTGTLKTMQQSIKADMLLKIAGAIGVLALAMGALSFIDPEKLVKSAVAIGVAFGELAGALKILEKMDFSASTVAKFTLMSLSLTLLGGSILMIGIALQIFARMSWEELAKGALAFSAIVGAMILVSKQLEDNAGDMAKAAFAMIEMAFSMDVMYTAVKKFASMDPLAMVQGFVGVAGAMALLVGTMKNLPDDLQEKTTGVLKFSIALNLMVFAIKQLGNMQLGELVQGGIGFAAMLGILATALNYMPDNLAATAGQILALAGAMLIMSVAMKIMATMSLAEMAKGLIGMAAAIGILALAMWAAEGGILGAGAVLVMAAALLLLSVAIKAFASIGLGEFAKGMLLVVAAIGALAGVAYLASAAILPMMGIGAGLALIGVGFAAIGFGALQFAKAIAMLSGVEDIGGTIIDTFKGVGAALPAIFIGVAEGIGMFFGVLAGFVPDMVKFGIKLISGLLEGLITIMPQILEFIGVMIGGIIDLIITLIPQFATAGIKILLGILKGIRDTLPQIVTVVGEIIVGFLKALGEQLPPIVGAVVDLFVALLTSVATEIGYLAPTLFPTIGIALMTGLIQGLSDSVSMIWDFFTGFVTTVIDMVKGLFGIHSPSTVFKDIGIDLLTGLLNGIVEAAVAVWDWFSALAGTVIKWIGDLANTLWDTGWDLVTGLWNGIDSFMDDTVVPFLTGLGSDIVGWVGQLIKTLYTKGRNLIFGLSEGIESFIEEKVMPFFLGLGDTIVGWIGDAFGFLGDVGSDIVHGLWSGINEAAGWLKTKMEEMLNWLPGWAKRILGISSPSKVFAEIGQWIPIGLGVGMASKQAYLKTTTEDMGNVVINTMEDTLSKIPDMLSSLSELDMSPVITPVIDLTNVRAGAATIGGLLALNSSAQAGTIASSQRYTEDSIVGAGPTEIKFEQTINAPKALSTADIYRATRNQITIAKEELSIV